MKDILEYTTALCSTMDAVSEDEADYIEALACSFRSDSERKPERVKVERYQVDDKVQDAVKTYFENNLQNYSIVMIEHHSQYPEDDYLYHVVARNKDGTYTVWTCWNHKTGSLSHGHSGLDEPGVMEILERFYLRAGERTVEDCIKILQMCREIFPKYNWSTCAECKKIGVSNLMLYTKDCRGIPFRLVCEDCYRKIMDRGYDGVYYDEADENF